MARTEIGGISYELQVPGQNPGTAFLQIDQARCIGCDTCRGVCPQGCIEEGTPFYIRENHCLQCGNCYEKCPVEAIRRY